MQSIKVNGVELEVSDGAEVCIEDGGKKISVRLALGTQFVNQYVYIPLTQPFAPQHLWSPYTSPTTAPSYPSTMPIITCSPTPIATC